MLRKFNAMKIYCSERKCETADMLMVIYILWQKNDIKTPVDFIPKKIEIIRVISSRTIITSICRGMKTCENDERR